MSRYKVLNICYIVITQWNGTAALRFDLTYAFKCCSFWLNYRYVQQFAVHFQTRCYTHTHTHTHTHSISFPIMMYFNTISEINCHNHLLLDSPWWALAFLRSFAHSSLLRATFFQFLTPNILMSWSTPSSHRSFGLPALLTPSGLVLNIFLIVLSSFVCTKCPAHASRLTLM